MAIRRLAVVGVMLALQLSGGAAAAPANERVYNAGFDDTWKATLQVLTSDLKLNIKTLDKASGLVQVESAGGGGNEWGDANKLVEQYTTRKVKALSLWSGFLLDCNLLLESKSDTETSIRINTSVQGFGGWKEEWVELESNGVVEKAIFDAIAGKVNVAPATAASTSTKGSPGTIELVSDPSGADVEVDGSFVGQTPATLRLAAGKHEIKVSRKGYLPWKRELKVLAGSSLSLRAEMEKR